LPEDALAEGALVDGAVAVGGHRHHAGHVTGRGGALEDLVDGRVAGCGFVRHGKPPKPIVDFCARECTAWRRAWGNFLPPESPKRC
jgi:hypothetical protein